MYYLYDICNYLRISHLLDIFTITCRLLIIEKLIRYDLGLGDQYDIGNSPLCSF